ncbi:MAG TPA: hypothetical protein VGH15_14115, partial [Caulobacteraceae bacterium]
MSSKLISGVYLASGYTLKASYDGVEVGAGAGVGGSGLTLAGNGYVTNYGHLHGAGINAASAYNAGVLLSAGGTVDNKPSGYIGGPSGITVDGAGSIANSGQIRGTRVAGAAIHVTGLGNVQNSALIFGVGEGIDFEGGGAVTNGWLNHAALIEGSGGVEIFGGPGQVLNYGSIVGDSADAVVISSGGSVVNGAPSDTSALIRGVTGVQAGGGATLANFGAIIGTTQEA